MMFKKLKTGMLFLGALWLCGEVCYALGKGRILYLMRRYDLDHEDMFEAIKMGERDTTGFKHSMAGITRFIAEKG